MVSMYAAIIIFRTGVAVLTFGNDLASTVDESARSRTEICKHYHYIPLILNFLPALGYVKPSNCSAIMYA